jgi:hypothetical protein
MKSQLAVLEVVLILLSPLFVLAGLGLAVSPERWARIQARTHAFYSTMGGYSLRLIAWAFCGVLFLIGIAMVYAGFAWLGSLSVHGLLILIVILLLLSPFRGS